jgi:hypothetical protein
MNWIGAFIARCHLSPSLAFTISAGQLTWINVVRRHRAKEKFYGFQEPKMNQRQTIICAGMLFAMLAPTPGVDMAALAQPSHLAVPQSVRFEHAAIVERLTKEAAKSGVSAAIAQKALVLIKAHFAKEEEFVFPPLGLLDQIAAGEVPTDSIKKAAIDMIERTKASKDSLQEDHIQITSMMNDLIQAATRANEADLVAFASNVAAHNLGEIEVMQPATLLIGDYLRSKSSPGQ